jgi:thioredoxin-related protein
MRVFRLFIWLGMCFLGFSGAWAQSGTEKRTGTTTTTKASQESIRWLSLDELQEAMKKKPKKVWIDVYTDWCGWCKRMDATTFKHPDVVRYMNEHFYAVKLNAEQKDSIMFMGKSYGFMPQYRANMFAIELLRGQMSYPSNVFMEENYQNAQVIPGYQSVQQMEMVLKYLAGGLYKTLPFDEYRDSFKPTWQ